MNNINNFLENLPTQAEGVKASIMSDVQTVINRGNQFNKIFGILATATLEDDVASNFMNKFSVEFPQVVQLASINSKPKKPQLYEPLLDPKNKKFTAFPITYQPIWKLYKQQVAAKWFAEEIDFSKDYYDFLTLNSDEQHFIKMVLAFFANSDGIVNFNLSERFTKEIQVTEAIFAYQWQIMMENIHSETYSLMLENIIKDVGEKAKLFDAIHTVPSIKSMADWTFKWIESDKSFAHRLVAFAIVEGVFFSGAFASIFWIKIYKGNNIMPGLLKSNELIARDEGMHCEFACLLYKYVINKLTDKQIGKIMREAVVIAQGFMQDALPIRLIGMNQDFMNDYIEYIGDRLLMMLGHGKIYNKKNPLEFMDTIAFANKGDFFVFRNTEYQDPHINNETKNTDFTQLSDDF